MRTLKFKHTLASEGRLTLAHPGAPLGLHGDACTLEITEVPDDVPDADVIRLAEATAMWGRDRARFEELGEGRLLLGKVEP